MLCGCLLERLTTIAAAAPRDEGSDTDDAADEVPAPDRSKKLLKDRATNASSDSFVALNMSFLTFVSDCVWCAVFVLSGENCFVVVSCSIYFALTRHCFL